MIFIAVFLISFSTIALQILQTRIFSFTLWHHLAYMVITIALMGMAAAGTWLAVKKRQVEKPHRFLALCSTGFSITSLLSLAIAVRVPLDTFMPDKTLQLGYIFLYYLILIFPYFFAGAATAFVFSFISKKVNLYYMSNLAGSAIGGVAILPVMEKFGGEGAVFAVALMGAISAFLFSIPGKNKKLTLAFTSLFVLLAILFPFKEAILPAKAPSSKALGMGYSYDPNQKIIHTQWDRVARIDVFENKHSQEFFNYFPQLENKIITIDGDAYTLLYNFPNGEANISQSLYSTAYHLYKEPKVLVVGLGGGTDIVTALHHNSRSVTGVEINKAMVEVTQDLYADFIGNPYQDSRVNIIHSEGRSFIRRSPDKFDIIQMSGVDTWAALSTGAYVMSESFIYTTNAMREYLDHLTDNGTLSIIRWLFWPPREMLKLCTQAVEVLKERGVENPENNIVVIGDGSLAAILIKNSSFSWTELDDLSETIAKTESLRIIYAPGFSVSMEYYNPIFAKHNFSALEGVDFIKNGFGAFFDAVEKGTEKKFISSYYYDIEPVNDDRPFFFKYYRVNHLFSDVSKSGGSFVDSMPIGLLILGLSLFQALFFSILFIVMPLFFMGKKEKSFSPLNQIIYFFMIGVGFMFIEMSLIQQFVLFLGNPADAISVTIMILLLSAGVGSLLSKKILIALGEKKIFGAMLIVLPLVIMGYAVFLPAFTHKFIQHSFEMRIILSLAVLFPLGFLLGQFFPTALTIVGEKNNSFIPWAYAVNGVASVVASIFSIILAMAYGFTFVFTMAAFCYFTASAAFLRFVQKHV
ncbi:MAG: hypothetical protein ACOX2F_12595 [bacterium]